MIPSLVLSQAYTDVAVNSGIDFVTVFSDDIFPTQGGAVWFEYDADADEDLFLTGGRNGDALYRNNGDGSFSDVTIPAGLEELDGTVYTMGAVSGDIDNDGYRELFITTEDHDFNRFYYNNGDGTFTDISIAAGVFAGGNSASASFGDVNLDGFIDLYVTNWCVEMLNMETSDTFPSMQNYLYINNGDLTFEESSFNYGVDDSEGCGLAATFTDYDNDGDIDILLGNDFGPLPGNSNNKLFQNQYPASNFLDVSQVANMDVGMFSMGVAIGDYDEDGDLDYYMTNEGTDALFNNSGGSFTYETQSAGVNNQFVTCLDGLSVRPSYGWGCGFADFDNDSYLDLFVVNGDLHWSYPRPCIDESKMFINQGDGTFVDDTQVLGLSDPYMSRGGAFADYDKDGDMDILLGVSDSISGNQSVRLFRNDLNSGNWISLNLVGTQGNRDGFGARVAVKFDGRTLIRECDGGSSFNSHHSSLVHFGLGTATELDTVRISWPSGIVDEHYHVQVNQLLEVLEQGGLVSLNDPNQGLEKGRLSVFPNPTLDHNVSYVITSVSQSSCSLFLVDNVGKVVSNILQNAEVENQFRGSFSLPENMSAGMYSLVLQTEEFQTRQTVVFIK